MKKSGPLFAILLLSAGRLFAQVTVTVELDQDQFLPGEAMSAEIRITNRSGQTLHLGKDPEWLTFNVESKEGFVVLKTGQVPVTEPFTLESSMRAKKHVNLAPYFNLLRAGRYTVTASVAVDELNRQISSDPTPFDIIQGAKMWEQDVGVPISPGSTNAAPETRTYTLQEASYLRRKLMLYVRVRNTTGTLNKVFPIGPLLSFGQPQPEVDRLSNLHVLYQDGPHAFSYTVINPDGEVIIHRSYDFTTRPRLQADPDGNLTVVGGSRRITPDDVPPPAIADTNARTPAR